MNPVKLFLIPMILALPLGACAVGEVIDNPAEAFPDLAKGKARITVFRNQYLGAAIQPPITIANQETGLCTFNGVFSVDVDPGKYLLSANGSRIEYLAVNAVAGQNSFVECSIEPGLLVGQPKLEAVDKLAGEAFIKGLVVTGTYRID